MPAINSSQFIKATDEDKAKAENSTVTTVAADEHGAKKDPQTGNTVATNPTPLQSKIAQNKPTASVSAAKPNNQATTAPTTNKMSATNPTKLADGKIGVTSTETELDGSGGVAVRMKRSDGVTMQFPFTFREQQDLHQVKNMFDLMNKMITLPEDKLREEFPSFVLG